MTPAHLAPERGAVLGIDCGGTTIKGEVHAPDGSVLTAERTPTPRGADAVTAIGELGDRLIAAAGVDVTAAAVVVPGLVDSAAGVARYSANIGWRDLPMTAPLSERWGLPVRLGHDVAAAAIAEMRAGAARGETHACLIAIGTGLAATSFSRGHLLLGPAGEIAELGHLAVRPGVTCACGGDGCLETVASASAIAASYAERAGREVSGAAEVAARLDHDDIAREVWQEGVDALADAIVTMCLLTTPALIVLGGGLGAAGEALAGPVREAVAARSRILAPPRIAVAELGDRGAVVGAAALARDGWAAEL